MIVIAVALPASTAVANSTNRIRTTPASTSTSTSDLVLIGSPTDRPLGFELTAGQAEQIAAGIPEIASELRRHPDARPSEYTKGASQWQVSWFNHRDDEIAQVIISDLTGQPTEAWTGFQVAWPMARGTPGSFGHKLNHPWLWVPLCVLFVVPFLPWRRRPSWLHIDLLVLLGFSISLAFFNEADIGVSVPLVYPLLLYLLVRMLLLGFGRGRPREPLRLLVPVSWLAIGLVALVGFRVSMNLSESGVIDVGYAGVIGADRLVHGKPLYGNWPADNATGDTYGPVNYYAYVPFRALWGWSGTWDQLPAGHAAAIAFDLLTMLLLFCLGRRVRGPTLGVVLAYLWAAYPFTLYTLQSNSNDALVSLLLVGTLLVLRSAPLSGVTAALSAFAKFAPFVLAPLFLRGSGSGSGTGNGSGGWPRPRRVISFVLAYGLTAIVVMLPVLLNGGWHTFWQDTIVKQVDRSSPFSVWGLWGGPGAVQHVVQAIAVLLAVAVAFVPRRRNLTDVAALAAAVMIAFELGLTHWFYLYIVWFFPLVVVALFAPDRHTAFTSRSPPRGDALRTVPRVIRRWRKRAVAVALLAALAAFAGLVSGCGSRKIVSSVKAPAPGGVNPVPIASGTLVHVVNNLIVPAKLTVLAGHPIHWENVDPTGHQLVSVSGARFDSGVMRQGQVFTWTPTRPGTIRYRDKLNRLITGTITVIT